MKRENIFNIRETAEILVPDKTSRISYVYAILLVVVVSVLISMFLGKLPPEIPLYFTQPWGESRLAPKQMLYLLPFIAFVFLVINLMFARTIRHLSPLLPRVLAVSTLVITLMLSIALFGIAQSLVL